MLHILKHTLITFIHLALVCSRVLLRQGHVPSLVPSLLPGAAWVLPLELSCAAVLLFWDTRSPVDAAGPVSVVVVQLDLEAATPAAVLARTLHQPVTMAAEGFACDIGIFCSMKEPLIWAEQLVWLVCIPLVTQWHVPPDACNLEL